MFYEPKLFLARPFGREYVSPLTRHMPPTYHFYKKSTKRPLEIRYCESFYRKSLHSDQNSINWWSEPLRSPLYQSQQPVTCRLTPTGRSGCSSSTEQRRRARAGAGPTTWATRGSTRAGAAGTAGAAGGDEYLACMIYHEVIPILDMNHKSKV